jgi:hypothetical protein
MNDNDKLLAWRGLPKRHRCDHCQRAAAVILEALWLCGDCFLEESVRRYPVSGYATTSFSTNTTSQPVRLRCS